jgi:hypothetical protein
VARHGVADSLARRHKRVFNRPKRESRLIAGVAVFPVAKPWPRPSPWWHSRGGHGDCRHYCVYVDHDTRVVVAFNAGSGRPDSPRRRGGTRCPRRDNWLTCGQSALEQRKRNEIEKKQVSQNSCSCASKDTVFRGDRARFGAPTQLRIRRGVSGVQEKRPKRRS